jgi:hypothetical protein
MGCIVKPATEILTSIYISNLRTKTVQMVKPGEPPEDDCVIVPGDSSQPVGVKALMVGESPFPVLFFAGTPFA